MENMKLELIRRDYFDPQAAILLKQYKLELWPGYVTSIRQVPLDPRLLLTGTWEPSHIALSLQCLKQPSSPPYFLASSSREYGDDF